MNKITTIIIIIIILLGGYFLLKGTPEPIPSVSESTDQESITEPSVTEPSLSEQASEQPPVSQTPIVKENIVTYTNAGYSPNTITIKVGETVVFKNESANKMWTASGVHPTHFLYSGTSLEEHCPDVSSTAFDQCGSGNEYSFTFMKSGTWKYHNHVSPDDTGTIVVE